MRRQLIDPRMLPRIQQHFLQQRASIETPIESADPYGSTRTTWTMVETGIPALVMPSSGAEINGVQIITTEGRFDIFLMGQWEDLDTRAAIYVDGQRYNVESVQRDPFGQFTVVQASIAQV